MASELEKIIEENFDENYRNIKCDFYKGVWLPQDYLKIADDVENFKVRDDDVWVSSFPKSGNTWTQEMVWCIVNDLDLERANIPLAKRFLYLEFLGATTLGCGISRRGQPDAAQFSIDHANQLPSPRFFKTHLPYHLLPRDLRMGNTKAKVVYITRNPKDVCISYYHQRVNAKIYFGTIENYCRLFLENRLTYTPYWEHLIGYWKAKDSDNIILLKFEDLKKDLASNVEKVCRFFKKSVSGSQIEMLCDRLNFEKMKLNPATNVEADLKYLQENVYGKGIKVEFMRKGKTDQWKKEMSEDLIKQFDRWIDENSKDYPDLRAHIL